MWKRTGQTMPCGGRRRRHGCWKPTGRWTSTASKPTPGCSSRHSTSSCASSCPTWSTWRSRSTSRTASSRPCRTSAKLSVSGTADSCAWQRGERRHSCWDVENSREANVRWGVTDWQRVMGVSVERWCSRTEGAHPARVFLEMFSIRVG